jgi:putative cell wall-binding protein
VINIYRTIRFITTFAILICLVSTPLLASMAQSRPTGLSQEAVVLGLIKLNAESGPVGYGEQLISTAMDSGLLGLDDAVVFYETEPNDTPEQANILDTSQLEASTYVISGMINDVITDRDIFRFELRQNGAFRVEAFWTGDLQGDPVDSFINIGLLDVAGRDLLEGYEPNAFFFYLPAGTYHLIIVAPEENKYLGEPYLAFIDYFSDVSIPDQNLKSRLHDVLGVQGRGITEWDMARLEGLDIQNLSIRNLTGLETAVNLMVLDAAGNQITNLSPLAGLEKMGQLSLMQNTGLTNILPLAGLTSMQDLFLCQTNVEDISMLSSLTELTTLGCSDTKVSDLSVLTNFPDIQRLRLGSERLSDLTPLADLGKMTELLIINSPLLNDLSPLAGLSQIQRLAIVGTLVSDITSLSGLLDLWFLVLESNRIEDISGLKNMKRLEVLTLGNNEIKDIGTLLDIQSNGALGTDSLVDLAYNELDISDGSQSMVRIEQLEAAGAQVSYYPQKWVARIAGVNRYRTAIEVSREGWLHGANTVVVTRGDNYADALAGVPLAYQLDAPILLTAPHQIGTSTLMEIKRLGAQNAIILGGTGAVSAAVESVLIAEGLNVQRIGGVSRYQTAVNIAEAMLAYGGSFDAVVVAVGTNFPDALAAASYAAMDGQPILLTAPTALANATRGAIEDLNIHDLLIVGGTGVISEEVEQDLSQYGTVLRISGSNRYETACALAIHYNINTDHYYIATGLDFPDAITGAVLAAKNNTGVLLVYGPGSSPNKAVRDFLAQNTLASVALFGGSSVVSESIADWFWGYFTVTE